MDAKSRLYVWLALPRILLLRGITASALASICLIQTGLFMQTALAQFRSRHQLAVVIVLLQTTVSAQQACSGQCGQKCGQCDCCWHCLSCADLMVTKCHESDWKDTFANVPKELEAGRFYAFQIDNADYDWQQEGGWGQCQKNIPGMTMHDNGIFNGTIPFNPALPNYTVSFTAFHNQNPQIGILAFRFSATVVPSACSMQPEACSDTTPNSYCGTDAVVARRFPDTSGCSCVEGYVFDSSDGICIVENTDTDSLLLQPELSYPIDGRSLIPLKDFSILLTFTETVQRGASQDHISLKTADGKLIERTACEDGPLSFYGRVMVVPVSMELAPKTMHSLTVPSTCVRKATRKAGRPFTLLAYDDASYNIETQPAGLCGGTPSRISGIKPSSTPGMLLPLEPAPGAWVTDKKTKYSIYFSEAMQAGRGLLTIKERTGLQAETILDAFSAADQERLQFDAVYKGRAHIGHPTWFKPGAQYTLTIGIGALADRDQNHLPAQFDDANPNSVQAAYRIRMSTKLVRTFPDHRCCKWDPKVMFTKNHRMVFDFADAVFAGDQPMMLCTAWSKDNACIRERALPTYDMVFLGKKVIANPTKAGLFPGQRYNVSISGTTFNYFSGISASAQGAWSYEFSLSNESLVDNEPPELLIGLVDCDGDGSLLGQNSPYSKICDADGDGSPMGDFSELMGTLHADGHSVVPTTAQFKLYFREKVAKTAYTQATLVADDDLNSPTYFREQDGRVVVGTGKYDSSVTLKPILSTGKFYTLSLGSGEITDDSIQKNPYGGTAFHFYTPLKVDTYGGFYPANGARNVPLLTAIRIRFADVPRLGPTPGVPSLAEPILKVDDETYSLTDTNIVKFQEKDILLLPKQLQSKRTYTVSIPKHHLRYMTTDLSFSFTTRFVDLVPPLVVATSPTVVGSIPKVTLDPSAPYVHLSESVSRSAAGKIQFYEDGVLRYSISAIDSDCAISSQVPTNPCLEMDSKSRKASFYPLGKVATGKAVSWATAGKTYRIDISEGAFTDSISTGATYNPISATSYSFAVDSDATGPTLSQLLVSGDHVESATMSLDIDRSADPKLNPAASFVMLFFNENVQVGDNSFALKSWNYSTHAPSLLGTSPTMTQTVVNDRTQTITLSFNCKVQAGAGSFQVFAGDSDVKRLPNIPTSTAHWFGTKVLFKPSTLLVNGVSYYVRSSHKDTIKTAGFGAAADLLPLNTKGSLRFRSQAGQGRPTVSWTSLDDYACLSASGRLPDVDIYLSEDVKLQAGRKVALCNSTASCWGSPQPANGVWSLTVPGQLALDIHPLAKYWATIYVSRVAVSYANYPLQESSGGSMWLGEGLFVDYGASLLSPIYSVSFSVCSTGFDKFGTSVVRLYSPHGLGTLSQGSARQFEVIIPASALKDLKGNIGFRSEVGTFEHEAMAPTVFPDACNPPFSLAASKYENIVLTFNEVVQAGTGSFEIFSSGGWAFSIPVSLEEALGAQQSAIFSNNKVSVTPKTLCDSTRRRVPPPPTNATADTEGAVFEYALNLSNYTNETFAFTTTTSTLPSNDSNRTNMTMDSYYYYYYNAGPGQQVINKSNGSNESMIGDSSNTTFRRLLQLEEDMRNLKAAMIDPCSQQDLEIGVDYWVTAMTSGVVRDLVGNPLAKSNSLSRKDSLLTFNPQPASTDRWQPAVLFHHADVSNAPSISGKVYFSEKIKQNTQFGLPPPLQIRDCGLDMSCAFMGDDADVKANIDITYGDGSTKDGMGEYGLLRYALTVPQINRRYRLTVVTGTVLDTAAIANSGPREDVTYYLYVGDVPRDSKDQTSPTIAKYQPVGSRVSSHTDIVLHFNEDVQTGTGSVSFCLNSDAVHENGPSCTVGKLLQPNGQEYESVFNVGDGILDRRVLTLRHSNPFKNGQKLYTLMPLGLAKDVSLSSNPSKSPPAADYSFTVMDEDTVSPRLQHLKTTTLTSGKVVLYFSEAVQAASSVDFIEVPSSDLINITGTVSGNVVTVSHTWTAGKKYRLNMQLDAFQDLSGNPVSSGTPMMSQLQQEFRISPDTQAPGFAATDTSTFGTSAASLSTVFAITFTEVVQKGTGTVSIYSLLSSVHQGLQDEIDVVDLPLASEVNNGMWKMKTVVIPIKKLMPGYEYSLRVPSTCFKDPSGNPFAALHVLGSYSFTVNLEQDCTSPKLLMVALKGNQDLKVSPTWPNPLYERGEQIVMYFTETVQSIQGNSRIVVKASTGGNFCSEGGAGRCIAGSTCKYACGYTPANIFEDNIQAKAVGTKFEGSKVTATMTGLQAGHGYKLYIESNVIGDVIGNALTDVVDGEVAGSPYSFRVNERDSDKIGPYHKTLGTPLGPVYPPTLDGEFPTHGTQMVPPSSTLMIQFSEVVQAGLGSISLTPTPVPGATVEAPVFPVSSCLFFESAMMCDPPGDLFPNTEYSVKFEREAVLDHLGNVQAGPLVGTTNSELKFTTIDLDFTAPELISGVGDSVGGELPLISKRETIVLTFSETVQAGSGLISIINSLNAVNPSIELPIVIDVQRWVNTGVDMIFINETVMLRYPLIPQGSTCELLTSETGVFRDVRGWPLALSNISFQVVGDDFVEPLMMQVIPKDDTTNADVAPSSDIMLYFSEPVQTIANKVVYVDGVAIPVDNSNPLVGQVKVNGRMVTVDPFEDVKYDRLVKVTVQSGTFMDLFDRPENVNAAHSSNFRTTLVDFVRLKQNDMVSALSPREGMLLHHIKGRNLEEDYFLLCGGLSGVVCMSDCYTSADASSWTQVPTDVFTGSNRTEKAPSMAYPKTAVDEDGCVWMFGTGDMCQLDRGSTMDGTLWKTCGRDDMVLWHKIPAPQVDLGPEWTGPVIPWTYDTNGIRGHAIAIVGGWRLVIVDSEQGVVWHFLDKNATQARMVADSVPFANRTDPILLDSASGDLFLMGGYNSVAKSCLRTDHYCADVFTDVWRSTDLGATWICLTAHYSKDLGDAHSKGQGRYSSALMAHDSTIFLLGGARPNATAGLDTVWSSYDIEKDTASPDDFLEIVSPQKGEDILTHGKIAMYFTEAIQLGTGSILLTDISDSSKQVEFSLLLNRQILTIGLSGQNVTAGHTMRANIPNDALLDTAGNAFVPGSTIYEFKINSDVTKPKLVDSFPSSDLANVSTLTTFMITFSEPVFAVAGAIRISSGFERTLEIPIDTVTIVNKQYQGPDNFPDSSMVFFKLPQVLTQNTKYNIELPAGLVKDAANNLNARNALLSFTTLSGSHTSRTHLHSMSEGTSPLATGQTMSSTEATTLVSVYPPDGATDVLCESDVSIYLQFTNPVIFNTSSYIYVLDHSFQTAGYINISSDQAIQSGVGTQKHLSYMQNGVRIRVGNFLKRGQKFRLSVPVGALIDAKNVSLPAMSKTFSCLAELPDITPPLVSLVEPLLYDSVFSTLRTVHVWFTEPVVHRGIDVMTLKKGDQTRTLSEIHDTVGTNITMMNLSLDGEQPLEEGRWELHLPKGLVHDLDYNEFLGHNTSLGQPLHVFFVLKPDVNPPEFDIRRPGNFPQAEKANDLQFILPVSVGFRFEFNEIVQAGQGTVRFLPKYSKEDVRVSVQSSSVAFGGAFVGVSPPQDLQPGEAYSVVIDAGSFLDVQGNAFQGLFAGYTVSTRAKIGFSRLEKTNGDYSFWKHSDSLGSRYGAGVVVDPANNMFVVGGHNATQESAKGQLNDVWMLATRRPVHCAASERPLSPCTRDGGPPTKHNTVTDCSNAGGKLHAGSTLSSVVVWRSASTGGRRCVNADGEAAGLVGQGLKTIVNICPCPYCKSAPQKVSKGWPHNNNITDFTFAEFLPLSAHAGKIPIECKRSFRPSSSFICNYDSQYRGSFEKKPYPECIPVCLGGPDINADEWHLTLEPTCNISITGMRDFAGGHRCNYTCHEGYGTTVYQNTSEFQTLLLGNSFDGIDEDYWKTAAPLEHSMYNGHWSCDITTWYHHGEGPCVQLTCDVSAWFESTSDWLCRKLGDEEDSWAAIDGPPPYNHECQIPCPQVPTTIITGKCELGSPKARLAPKMIFNTACPTTTTTTTTTTIALPPTTTTTTTTTTVTATTVTFPDGTAQVVTSIALTGYFGDETAKTLKANAAWIDGFRMSIVAAFAEVDFDGPPVKMDDVQVMELVMFNLGEGTRRLRRLQLEKDAEREYKLRMTLRRLQAQNEASKDKITAASNATANATATPNAATEAIAAPNTTIEAIVAPNTTIEATVASNTSIQTTAAPLTTMEATAAPLTTMKATADPLTTIVATAGPSTTIEATVASNTTVEAQPTTMQATAAPLTTMEATAAPRTTMEATVAPLTTTAYSGPKTLLVDYKIAVANMSVAYGIIGIISTPAKRSLFESGFKKTYEELEEIRTGVKVEIAVSQSEEGNEMIVGDPARTEPPPRGPVKVIKDDGSAPMIFGAVVGGMASFCGLYWLFRKAKTTWQQRHSTE